MADASGTPSASSGRRGRLAVLYVLVFLGVFLLTCQALAGFLEAAPGAQLENRRLPQGKHRYFAQHKDRYDVVFVGSSRVLRELQPSTFDDFLEGSGHPVSSFNFGLVGMTFPEARHIVDWILRQEPARLRWLVIELLDPDPHLDERNYFTRRFVSWHTPAITADLCEAIARSDRGLPQKLAETKIHLQHLGLEFCNVGRGLPVFRHWTRRRPLPAIGDGWVPNDRDQKTGRPLAPQARYFQAQRHRIDENRQAFLDSPTAVESDPLLLETLGDFVRDIRAAGVEPVFVLIPPVWSRKARLTAAGREGAVPTLLEYHDLEEYPEFYQYENLFNLSHLNSQGGRLLTLRLAADFVALIEADPPSTP